MNPNSLWKTFGNFHESFGKYKGDLKQLLTEVLKHCTQAQNTTIILSGLNNLFNIVDQSSYGLIYGFLGEL
jgi:hypothetical protein